MRVVVDTNVIVSALMNTSGIPSKILSLTLKGDLRILYDNRIIFEYIDVLSRKEFGFPKEIIDDLINFFKHEGELIISDYINKKFTDETDKKFYEVYKTGKAEYLITGNKKHFPKEETIISPKDFLLIFKN
ncbi:putative toxin-antitoxin system toxin component, PIN family [Treponema sp. R80B11-R83G3]